MPFPTKSLSSDDPISKKVLSHLQTRPVLSASLPQMLGKVQQVSLMEPEHPTLAASAYRITSHTPSCLFILVSPKQTTRTQTTACTSKQTYTSKYLLAGLQAADLLLTC